MKRAWIFCLSIVAATSSIGAQQVPKGQMPILGRATESTDAVPLFDFETYFLGKWTFEWSMPESPLGPAGPYTGTTTIAKINETFYEALTEGDGPNGPFKIREVLAYQKDSKTLAREVTDSRGFSYLQFGPVGGDLGGIYNIHFESAPFMANGKSVRVRNVMRLLSPLNYRVATSISVDGGPFTNLGTPWWRKAP
ncbi:MAG: hypothetical protein ABI039_10005 [Vicinamibacterales bacterium]